VEREFIGWYPENKVRGKRGCGTRRFKGFFL